MSGEDVGTILLTLARGHPDLLALASPLHTGGDKVSLPPEALRRVRDPPSLDATLAALAAAFGEVPTGARPPLPPDLERALSMLGQGILAAEALRVAGDPYAGAMALRDAYELALPLLERDTILLSHPEAYGALAHDEPAAQAALDELLAARKVDDALRFAGIPEVRPIEARPVAEALALLYLRFGLPIDRETRAALEAAEALDPALRDPIERALAHVERAWVLRDEALAPLTPGQRAALASSPIVRDALLAPAPTAADLAVLARYGAAVDALDREKLLEAAGHALFAGQTLRLASVSTDGLLPCCTGESDPDDPSVTRVGVGGLVVEARTTGRGDVRVWIGEGDAEPTVYPNAFAAVDTDRVSVVVYDDSGQRFSTPPLADPSNDVLFQDPYGLVVVSGPRSTTTDARFGGRSVEVLLDGEGPSAGPVGAAPLDQLDAALARSDPYGAWPVASDPLRRALEAEIRAPTLVRARVNPASYQVLRWDLGGDDVYTTNAGGAGSRGLVTVEADGAGEILREDAFAAPLPVAILVDAQGNDLYETRENDTLASANASLAILLDAQGKDVFRSLAARGLVASDAGGIALLLAGPGNATYEADNTSAARASGAATALLLDQGGDDSYRARNVTLGASELGALALLLDAAGDDTYRSRAVSQGASRGGIAAFVDAEGNDTYAAADRPDAQGWAEGYDGIGAARLALFLDGAGDDRGVCPEGSAQNAQLGAVTIGRAPSDPFNPAAGFCLELDAAPIAPLGDDGSVAIPPTFFASALANFTVPGIVRLGSIGPDVVLDPYLLSVDILGDDTYAVGAVARVAAPTEARDFGWIAPVSLHVDTDGNDTHDARLSSQKLPGAFGYAEGGIALQATTTTERFQWGADAPTMLNDTFDRHLYRNVTRGLGAAANGGVALFVRDGLALDVTPASAQAPCLLACARTGGVAFAIGRGPGDSILATPWSLGAVQETELGGLAIYYARGGRDSYRGSNLSMGYAARAPGELAHANIHEALVERRPNVALFIDDGFERDDYATPLNWSRGNERFWEDRRTIESFSAFGNRSLHAAQGVDNLDWYANTNLAAADEGVAEDTGPGTNEGGGEDGSSKPSLWEPAFGACQALPMGAGLPSIPGNLCRGALNASDDVFSTYNSTNGLGIERGDGGSATTPDGLRPVTLARTAFNPAIEAVQVKYQGSSGAIWYDAGDPKIRIGDSATIRLRALDPPAYADQTLIETALDRPSGTTLGSLQRGRSIQRVELSIVGRDATWTGCLVPEMRDTHQPKACRVAFWDRDLHGEWNLSNDLHQYDPSSRSAFEATINVGALLLGSPSRALFPPGNYTLILRAYAARPYDLPDVQGGEVRLGVLQGLASDALNLSDENYGLYGSAFFLDVPIVNRPQFLPSNMVIVDSNGVTDAVVEVNVTEPVRYDINVSGGSTDTFGLNERYRTNLSLRYHDSAAFAAAGHDTIRFVWKAGGRPPGLYFVWINMTGKLSNATFNTTFVPQRPFEVYVDDSAPAYGVDPRGMPASLNATNSPRGLVTLATDKAQIDSVFHEMNPVPQSPIARIDIWVREEILDAADPGIVLDARPWRHAAVATGTGYRTLLDRSSGVAREFGTFEFSAEAEPGPPRRYSFAAYLTDRAGNRRVADPTTTVPAAPDCVFHLCATFLYDISPPRTLLKTLDPPPAVGRIGTANVSLRIDASETPDVAQQTTLAALLSPGEDAAFDRAMMGDAILPAPRVPRSNATAYLDPLERAIVFQDETGVAGTSVWAKVRVKAGDAIDDAFDNDTPLYLEVRVLDVHANATVAGPWTHNVTGQLPLNGFTHELLGPNAGTSAVRNASVGFWVELPNASGVYILSVTPRSPSYPAHTNFSALREGFVVWDVLDAPDANGTLAWKPPRAKLAHGNVALLMTRAIDRAGNLEEKGSYDTKLAVDLVPPALTSPPEITVASHAASVRMETDEPALAALAIVAPNGTIVANTTLAPAANVHATTLGGLLPETDYTLRMALADELANAAIANVTFRTGSLMDVTLAPIAPVLAENASVRFSPNATIPTRVTHSLDLSLDGGATFPHAVGTLRAVEVGNVTRAVAIDPTAFGESVRAQLRLTTTLIDAADQRVVVYSPLFTLDGHAPKVTVSANRSLAEPTRHPLLVDASASDGGTGVARIEWSRAGAAFVELRGPIALEGIEPETLLVRAIDRAGHVSEPSSARLFFDRVPPNLAPTTAIVSPTAASVIPVWVRASDEHAGLAHVAAFEGEREAFRLSGADLASGEAVALWTLDAGEGQRALRLVATDRAGNAAEEHLTIRADRRAPSASFRLVERTTDALRVEVSFDEPTTVLATLSSREGARVLASRDDPTRALVLAIDHLAPGAEHQIAIRVRDAAGNVGTATRTFSTTRDFDAPSGVEALKATNLPDGAILLEWPEAHDESGVRAYHVLRGEGDADPAPLASVQGERYLDLDVTPGASYAYAVVPMDAAGNLPDGYDLVRARSRTAPSLDKPTARWEGGELLVELRGTDADGDAPSVALWASNASFPLDVVPASSGWQARGLVAIEPGTFGRELRYHVEVDDGLFTARWPPTSDALAPPAIAESVADEGFLVAAAHRVPLSSWWTLAAVLVAVALARRRSS